MICEFCYKPVPASAATQMPAEWQNHNGLLICPECVMRIFQANLQPEDCRLGMFSYGADPRTPIAPPQPTQTVQVVGGNLPPNEAIAHLELTLVVMAQGLVNEFLFSQNNPAPKNVRDTLIAYFIRDAKAKAQNMFDSAPPAIEEAINAPHRN